ncbi:MAG TPA: ATP-dependent DNA helicase [Micromonosporaceae bacterium]|jgi:DNA helicase-2/ATP-dependent DNA helicase PcrA
MTLPTSGPRHTPAEIADLLGLHTRPTPEQAAIIAAPVAPLLVVAGAGAGKTETMAARVVWLVANDYVRPEQILGITFTRKAAGELGSRIRQRLAQLVRKLGTPDAAAGEPTVATYHSYAARIVAEHGVRAGFEPTTRLLTEASCWQIADAVVRTYGGDMSDVDYGPAYVTDAVLHLAADLSEHLRTPAELAAWTGRFYADATAPSGRVYADVTKMLTAQNARLALLPMVREYARRKLAAEAMDFGDQLARAAHVATAFPEVGAIERDRFRVVLLDEYQDTSHAQTTILRQLFGGGHPVTAVGDPCQSIYGWRGASAGTLDRFPADFPDRSGHPAAVLTLSTSWRNRPEILTVANLMSEPLRGAGHHVTKLVASPTADDPVGASTVRCALLETYADEAAWVGDRIAAAWRHRARIGDDEPPERIPVELRPSTAVLVRTRRQIVPIERALRERGLPVEVVGLGGLLDTPEVRDVVSTLEVLADPLAGASLLRLLTGPRWRIGPRDLVALYGRSRSLLASRRQGLADEESGTSEPLIPGRLDEAALIDALDDPGRPERYSEEGFRRLSAFGEELRGLRQRLDQPLPDLVAEIERAMGVDVEVSVRAADTGLARAHLDAFAETATRFAAEAQGATLAAFLAFLTAAESEERGLAAGEIDIVEGAVQILTVHAAKGLEWDVVAVAGLSSKTFPSPTDSGDHFLGGLGMLPFPLRGDAAGLPSIDLTQASTQVDVKNAYATFIGDWAAHAEREERRLAYVATTRPRQLLLASGYWWAPEATRPRGPSTFLEDVRRACESGAGSIDVWAPPPPAEATNPALEEVQRSIWPADPLGDRRGAIESAASLVRSADITAPIDEADDEAVRWAYEVDLLLAERDRTAPDDAAVREVSVPTQLSVSHLVALRQDAPALARSLRRPMPRRPDPYARRGTAFHRWLEQRFGADHLLDIDELPGAGDDNAAADSELADLQERFLAGEWAARTPIAVEVPFSTSIDGVVIRGRMDAVFADADGYDVVDWKTGRRPTGASADAAAIQLGAYRLAWAELAGVPVESVRAAFVYVRDGVTVRPADLIDRAGLIDLVSSLPERTPDRT